MKDKIGKDKIGVVAWRSEQVDHETTIAMTLFYSGSPEYDKIFAIFLDNPISKRLYKKYIGEKKHD